MLSVTLGVITNLKYKNRFDKNFICATGLTNFHTDRILSLNSKIKFLISFFLIVDGKIS